MKTYARLFGFALVLVLLFGTACSKKSSTVEPFSVDSLAQDILGNFDEMNNAMAAEIEASAHRFGCEAEIRDLLTRISTAHSAILTSCYVDPKGILKYLEPAEFKSSEGADISMQAHTISMLENPAPTLSTAFRAVEGFATVALAHPLYDANQNFAGSLVLTLDPSVIAQLVLDKNAVPSNYEIWAMEPDGMIVCDQDKAEIGINLFSDPVYQPYESLRNLGAKIAASSSGEGQYVFKATGSDAEVSKSAIWKTISIHGREWRVVLVKQV